MQWLARLLGGCSRHLFDQAPCLAPWYFSPERPGLKKNGVGMRWQYIEKIGNAHVGVFALMDSQGACYGFAGIYTCLLAHPDGHSFLVWHYEYQHGNAPGMLLSLYETNALLPISDREKVLFDLQHDKQAPYFFNASASETAMLTVAVSQCEQNFLFPEAMKSFPDFCIVTTIPGIYPQDTSRLSSAAILSLSPSSDKLYLYPQDWFNQADDMDFGYQWITRAVKNPRTGLIHTQGIRLGEFVLDKTGRQRQ